VAGGATGATAAVAAAGGAVTRGFLGGGETGFDSGGEALAAEGWIGTGAGAGDTVGEAAGGATAAAGAGGGAGVGAAAAAGAALLGVTALTAVWQGAESWAMCCFRQAKASAPPRGTPEQFAMKSDRHDARIALTWSGVGCCARALPGATKASAAIDRAIH
jgi:hypothetical protein